MTTTKTIRIAHAGAARPLSAEQKKFNSLVKRIEAQRRLLGAWKEAIPLFQERHTREFEPLLEIWYSLTLDLVRFLDGRVSQKGFNQAERHTMQELICDLATRMMYGEDHDEMKALYAKHSATAFDTEEMMVKGALKSMVEDAFGIDLGGDVDMDAPEAAMQRMEEAARTQQEHAAQTKGRRRGKRKVVAGPTQQQAEAQHASRSMREVYRKLASALHPDREPDPRERERKTALMQRVNQAYAAEDLLSMLQVQLEIEQVDQGSLDNMAADRLKHYSRVLAQQLSDLQNEIRGLEHAIKAQLGRDPYERVSPGKLMQLLRSRTQQLEYDIHQLRKQRQSLDNVKSFKRWLKEQHAPAEDFDDLVDVLNALYR